MTTDQVLQRFTFLARLTPSQAEEWQPICEEARERILSQCRADVVPEDHEGVLCAAAAALAFYQYSLLEFASEPESVAVGDVKITNTKQTAAVAEQLWKDARAQAAGVLLDENFLFERIGKSI